MSGNENVSGTTGDAGPAGPAHTEAGWGWEPVPQGGEYDSDATAFVKLPQDMLDALGTGEPLAAPGHGYVPPPMIVPLGSGSADPSATGTWTVPAQWPDAGTAPQGGGTGTPAGVAASGGHGPAPVGGPIPASIPLPASVAAAFADQAQAPVHVAGHGAAEAAAAVAGQVPAAGQGSASAEDEHDPGATAEWRFPDAVQGAEPVTTGQWTLPELAEQTGEFHHGAPAADWSQAPATLPGGAAAPWATHPDFEAARPDAVPSSGVLSSGVLPEARPDAGDPGTSGAGLRRLGVLVGRPARPAAPTGADKTSVVLWLGDDHPGALL
ncbi:hypothetical protein OV450_3594, partial [Actinobacteria bacterium OV450]